MGSDRPHISIARRIKYILPSRRYLKLYAWTIGLFHLLLFMLFYLFGHYLGYADVWLGVVLISFMMLFSFLAVLLFGVLLQIIDPE